MCQYAYRDVQGGEGESVDVAAWATWWSRSNFSCCLYDNYKRERGREREGKSERDGERERKREKKATALIILGTQTLNSAIFLNGHSYEQLIKARCIHSRSSTKNPTSCSFDIKIIRSAVIQQRHSGLAEGAAFRSQTETIATFLHRTQLQTVQLGVKFNCGFCESSCLHIRLCSNTLTVTLQSNLMFFFGAFYSGVTHTGLENNKETIVYIHVYTR